MTGLSLRLTGYRGMGEFAEIDLDERLAVVRTGARPSVSSYQSTGSLRGNFEPFPQCGIRQHLDGHDIRSRLAGHGNHPDSPNVYRSMVAGSLTERAPGRGAGMGFTKVGMALLPERRSPDGAKRNPGKYLQRMGRSRVALRSTRATRYNAGGASRRCRSRRSPRRRRYARPTPRARPRRYRTR